MFLLSFFTGIFGWVWSAIKWVLANPKVIPYLVIAALGLGLYIEHAKLQRSQRETATIKSEYQTAVTANQSDAATIAALQKGVADLTAQLGQEQKDAAASADKASQTTRALNQRLAAAQLSLAQLGGNPSYASYLNIDLNAQYPELASWLRQLDAPT
jgi:hypothetical protein